MVNLWEGEKNGVIQCQQVEGVPQAATVEFPRSVEKLVRTCTVNLHVFKIRTCAAGVVTRTTDAHQHGTLPLTLDPASGPALLALVTCSGFRRPFDYLVLGRS